MILEPMTAQFEKRIKILVSRLPDDTFCNISFTLKTVKAFCEIHRQDEAIPVFWRNLYPLEKRIDSGVKLSKEDASLIYYYLDSLHQAIWRCVLLNRKLKHLSQKYFDAIIEDNEYFSLFCNYESNPKRGRVNPYLLLIVVACVKSNKKSAVAFEFENLKELCERINKVMRCYFSDINVITSVDIKNEATGTFNYFVASKTITLLRHDNS